MGPNAIIAAGLTLTLVAWPASAGPAPGQGAPKVAQDQAPTREELERIREAVNRPPALKIEQGQLKIYVEVIGNWPTFAEATKGYDFINGPTGFGSPMSHQEFLGMVTPQDMYSTAGIKPAEIVTMAAVNVVGHWAISKALSKIGSYRKDKQMRDIQAQIDAELAAIKKNRQP
jgi:hypothetical protein